MQTIININTPKNITYKPGGNNIRLKNVIIILLILSIFLLSTGFICAAESNSTAVPLKSSAIENDTPDIEPSATKTFTDLALEIDNAPSDSVLVLHGKYKYDSSTDEKYKRGVSISKDIVIIGSDDCIIDGNKKARCLKIDSKCSVALKNIIFKNGHSKNSPGGAIYSNSNSKLKIYNCEFRNNVAYNSNGGAVATGYKVKLEIYNTKFFYNKAITTKKGANVKKGMGGALEVNLGSKLTMNKCIFKKNKAHLAIILVISHNKKLGTKTSKVYVKNCRFERNKATINGVFYLDEYGKGKFIKCIFKYNTAKKGGILILDTSKYALVKNCYFYKNTAIFGGAIKLVTFKKHAAHVSIISSKFKKNWAKKAGGAIFSDHGKLKISKSKFIKNRARVSGGAVEIRHGSLKIIKSLFKKNRARFGGAILVKNKKSIKLYKSKFVKNKASKGKKILGIYNHQVFKLKIKKNKKKKKH